ncbi:flippase-like domain-containing protein [Nonlabens sp. SCSIO 43208]|nr:lysylphosphatidylglycerol synthase domain-containing protein [Nonlabens tegetincola]ARN70221.1 hypothetical protein BST91_00365 [Nonlabens tegetincola]
MISLSYKTKQLLSILLKTAVFLISIVWIYFTWKDRSMNFKWFIDSISLEMISWIILMIAISLISWLIESRKWQYLVKEFYELRFRESVLQNLTSQAASFITPFRLGEFALKSLFFSKAHRKNVVSKVFWANFSQMVVTSTFGIASIITLSSINDKQDIYFILLVLSILIIGLFSVRFIDKKLQISTIPQTQLVITIGYSLLRYLVFASNWIIVLWALNYDFELIDVMLKIGLYYLLVSVVPVLQLLDLPVRYTVASIVFESTLQQEEVILIASTIVWFTNTAIPTLLGCALLPFKSFKLAQA